MYIGLLDEWKGYRTFLEAAKELKDKKEIEFVIIGGTDEQINKLKKEYPEVNFLGYYPYSELPINQKVGDILVIPNSGNYKISSLYTSPIKLFAHMASGVPLLVSDLPSLREIVDDSMVYFFESDNKIKLAEKISYILNNKNEAEVKAKKAVVEVEKYTWIERARNVLIFIK